MHASNAKARIMDLADRSRKRPFRRRLGIREFIRMPCLLPATVIIVLGLLAVAVGAGMSVVGYVPSHTSHNVTNSQHGNNTQIRPDHDSKYLTRKIYSYIGPILMAVGIFAMITACVFYCEVLDKYTILVPNKRVGVFNKEELYNIIVGEMKKSYAQTLVTVYSKAAEQSLLADNQSSSGDYLHEPIFPYKANETLTLEQQIDIECEGYTPSPPIPNKRYSIIQARIQRLKSEDNWLKTSSLPNIRRIASIKRAGRVGAKITDSRTLSCDYTMDEARLRRKSMMLRTIVQWNSGSSDLFAQRQRRFSSVKALPSYHNDSFEDVSENEYGSFPLTRLIQRRGTFACGDMKTRRMKFLLLLEASESLEGFNDSVPVDGRHTVAGIRRNSFIPYTTCDKFIAGEERKTSRDRRRSSVNPFSLRNRVSTTVPEPVVRRHSFYPIRRDSKIYSIDPNEHRRHSFNPVGINNTLKPEFAANADGRRSSFNPDGLPGRTEERRPSRIMQQNTRFLQVPGLDPYMEGWPTVTSNDVQDQPQHSMSDSGYCYSKSGSSQLQTQGFQDDRRIDRRHSFNPIVRLSAAKGDGAHHRLPKITINEDNTERFLSVPCQDYYIEERDRRHSFNMPPSKHVLTTAAPSKFNEKPNPQRISFKLEPSAPSAHLSPTSSQTVTKSTLKTSKPSSDPVRPSSFKQEMVVFRPLRQPLSRSASPCSNASCCGSDKIGSEHSGAISRTASMCSDRSAKTTLTASPGPTDSSSSYGPFQQYIPSPKHSRESAMLEDSKSNISQTQQPNKLKLDIPFAAAGSWYDAQMAKKSAFQYSGKRGRARHQHIDTPGSTNSGPATLSTGSRTDTSTTIHRSKSASALPGTEATMPLSHHTTFSYAKVPKPSSPLVTRHKMKSRQAEKKSS